MKKIITLFILISINITVISAQTYQWQWAKQGGGDNGSTNVGFSPVNDEFIRDVVVDNNNNSYYLSAIYPGNPKLNGVSVTNYNNRDLFLFSTDCAGNVRWTRTVGGFASGEEAWKLEVDNSGGLYIMARVINQADTANPTILPPRFDDNNVMPLITIPYNDNTSFDAGLKTTFLLKYNTSNGTLAWQKPLQGNVNIP